jgi:hydroxypyruvate isomerase
MPKGPKISADITRLFTDLELPERIGAAAEAGFKAVEIPLPYDHPAPALRDTAVFAGIPIVRMDAPPPNYTGGVQGFAAQPESAERFRRDVARAVRQAAVLGAPLVHLRAGTDGPGDSGVLVDNLRFAAQSAPKATFLVALLNPRCHPGHCLATPEAVTGILARVGQPNVKLLFSSWHANRQPDGLRASWEICAPHVGHVLLGGGHAGESDHRAQAMLELARMSGYTGWACAAYAPKSTTRASLGWLTS